MQHRILHFVDACAGFQQIAIRRAGGVDRRWHVGVAGQHEQRIQSGESGLAKILPFDLRRDEITG